MNNLYKEMVRKPGDLCFEVSLESDKGLTMTDLSFALKFFVYGHPKNVCIHKDDLKVVEGKYYAVLNEHGFVNGVLFCEAEIVETINGINRIVSVRSNTGYVIGNCCEQTVDTSSCAHGYSLSLYKVEYVPQPIDPNPEEDQLIAEELFGERLSLPELTADRAIADEHGNRIADTYETRQAVRNHIREVYNEQFNENPPLIMDGYITPQMLSESTKQLLENTGQNITNVPDGEDLTTKNGVLKLSDKPYNPGAYSGLGRIYLRKNLVGGQNLLTQAMVSKPNTIYILQYDYTLDGKSITIPEGCVLSYEGGSIRDGHINYTDTLIHGTDRISNVTTSGACRHAALPTDEEDITGANGKNLKFKDKEYAPQDYSGLGRIYLRKNIKTVYSEAAQSNVTINLLEQSMIDKPNTIYIIQYDYDLNGAEITIPEGCVLDFQGGSLRNGVINLASNTSVENSTFNDVYVGCIGKHINISGIKFNVKNQEKTILKIEESEDIHLNKLEFNTEKVYTDNNCGNISVVQSKYVSIQNCTLHGGVSDGSGNIASYSLLIDISEFITINNVLVKDCPSEGIGIVGSKYVSVLNSKGESCGWSFVATNKKHDPEKFCTHIIVDGCACYNSGASGYSFNCSESVLSNSIAIDYKTNNGVAIGHPTDMVWDVIVSNCYFKANLGENAHKYTFGARIFSSGKVTISNCQFKGDMSGGIGITSKDSNILVTGCIFDPISYIVHIHTYEGAIHNKNVHIHINNNIITSCKQLVIDEYSINEVVISNNNIDTSDIIYESSACIENIVFSDNRIKQLLYFSNTTIRKILNLTIKSNIFENILANPYNVFLNISSVTNSEQAPNIEISNNTFNYIENLAIFVYLRSGSVQEGVQGYINVINNIINKLANTESFSEIITILTNNVDALSTNNVIKSINYTNKGATGDRPSKYLNNTTVNYQYFDTTLNKPIWWTGTKWVDATGAEV